MNSTQDRPDFIKQQYAFAAHIRDPEKQPAPDNIEDRRMAIYRDLFYNNIEGFLSANFPVLRELTSDDRWHAMVRDFFIRHRCETPHFPEIAQEFLDYMANEREQAENDYPFTIELAHYEWVELALTISDADRVLPPYDPNGDLIGGQPLISPLAWNLSYTFPVHTISPDNIPTEVPEQPTNLVVYRNRMDEVVFLEINAVTQRLLQLIKDEPELSGAEVIEKIAQELKHPQPEAVIAAGIELLNDLKQRNIIIGAKQ